MELILGVLAAWGLIMLLWTLTGVLLLPLSRRKDIRLTVLIRSEDRATRLEQYLKGILWLRDMGILWWDVLILEDHMDDEARQRARILTQKEHHVSVVTMDTLTDWMES